MKGGPSTVYFVRRTVRPSSDHCHSCDRSGATVAATLYNKQKVPKMFRHIYFYVNCGVNSPAVKICNGLPRLVGLC